jgi:hypothetical protein
MEELGGLLPRLSGIGISFLIGCAAIAGIPLLNGFVSEWLIFKSLLNGSSLEPTPAPLQRQVELWRKTQITDDTAKLIFYSAFIDGKLEAPRTLLPEVHRLYFEPQYPEFSARTMWSLSNAFTSAFKKLDPVPQFKATAKLGAFLAQVPN